MQLQTDIVQTTAPQALSEERAKIIDYVRRFGGSASDAVLDLSCEIFTLPYINGFIGYRLESSCAVVYGDPLCDPHDLEQLACAFHELCAQKGLNVIYITATEAFAKWALEHGCKTMIEFGEELFINPQSDPRELTGVNASLVRRKVRHAIKEGVVVSEYTPYNAQKEKEIEEVGLAWLQARNGPQIHTSNIHPFANRPGKRWFYASHQGKTVGVVILHQLQSRKGWLLNHLMQTPSAPNGTPELLLISALEAAAKEGCRFITFGSVPGSSLKKIEGIGLLSQTIARQVFWLASKIFRLDGRRKFWSKFHPDSAGSYLVFTDSTIGWREIKALMLALNISLTGKKSG